VVLSVEAVVVVVGGGGATEVVECCCFWRARPSSDRGPDQGSGRYHSALPACRDRWDYRGLELLPGQLKGTSLARAWIPELYSSYAARHDISKGTCHDTRRDSGDFACTDGVQA